MPANDTNARRLARALAAAGSLSYQAALHHVQAAQRARVLPARLDSAGRAEALQILLRRIEQPADTTAAAGTPNPAPTSATPTSTAPMTAAATSATPTSATTPETTGHDHTMSYPQEPTHAGQADQHPVGEPGALPYDPRFPSRPLTADFAALSRAAHAVDDEGTALGVPDFLRKLGQDPERTMDTLHERAAEIVQQELQKSSGSTPSADQVRQKLPDIAYTAWITGFSSGVGRIDTDSAIRQQALAYTGLLKQVMGQEVTVEDISDTLGVDYSSVVYLAQGRTARLMTAVGIDGSPDQRIASLMMAALGEPSDQLAAQIADTALLDGLCIGMQFAHSRTATA